MPTYLYRCHHCHVEFERIEMFADPPLVHCPECQVGAVYRIPQLSTVVFKGSGWYATDHRSLSDQKTRVVHKEDDKTAKTSVQESNR